ncbi:hypothetical protein B0I37DRAFT_351760 [Chaetomium sp. MPI-CAGE-AT-0009]|nr:hypothetical protein B0I37DRAFT_351760 [Chaetomium sp. MPI-CAGE-AT-0009]
MTRQYFCWKVSLTYRCGCTELAPIAHRCPPDREGCNSWLTHKRTDKECEAHRTGWGLAAEAQTSAAPPSSAASASSSDSSPGPSGPSRQGVEGEGGGEGGVRRRGDGEAEAAASGRRVVGYY